MSECHTDTLLEWARVVSPVFSQREFLITHRVGATDWLSANDAGVAELSASYCGEGHGNAHCLSEDSAATQVSGAKSRGEGLGSLVSLISLAETDTHTFYAPTPADSVAPDARNPYPRRLSLSKSASMPALREDGEFCPT